MLVVVAPDEVIVSLDVYKDMEDMRIGSLRVQDAGIVPKPGERLLCDGGVHVRETTIQPLVRQRRARAARRMSFGMEAINAPKAFSCSNCLVHAHILS